MEALILHELVHPADIPVADFTGDFQFILEALQGAFVPGDLRPNELYGNFLIQLLVHSPIDLAHAAVAQLLDDLVPTGEGRACGELSDGCLKGFRHDMRIVVGRRKLSAAFPTEFQDISIVGATLRTIHGSTTQWLVGRRIKPSGKEVNR
jgi:hypothetical protein